jgi:predicted amino acid dehydrogenase
MKDLLNDLLIRVLPEFLIPKSKKKYHFCFLGHPRDYKEIHRKFPFFKALPNSVLGFITQRILWPVTATKITGLKNVHTGQNLTGCVVAIPVTAVDMLKNRAMALRKIRRAVRHAKKQGATLVGLAGYTASLSRGGLDLMDLGIDVTTGHAYTALNVVQNYEDIMMRMDFVPYTEELPIAIVGAAGSVGSTVAKYLVHKGIKEIILIDLDRKKDKVEDLVGELRVMCPSGTYHVSSEMEDVKKAVIVFTATNASEALITPERTVPGMVFIDDTQPTDISKETHYQKDVLVLEAGAVRTPGVRTHFKFGLKHPEDNFCCMAELLALAAHGHQGHYVVNRATLDNLIEMDAIGKTLGFRVGDPQNLYDTVDNKKIQHVAGLVRQRLGV